MGEDFEKLPIKGGYISKLTVMTSKKVHMTILKAPSSPTERQMTMEYSLQFNQVRTVSIDVIAEPWLEIKSQNLQRVSELLLRDSTHNSEEKADSQEFLHFHLECAEGQINIIATDFTFAIVDEILHVNRNKRPT